jgi:chromosome segregation ATPase
MGAVSLLEDAIERWGSDLEALRKKLTAAGQPSIYAHADELEAMERTLSTIKHHLELATDPNLNLEGELANERLMNKELQKQMSNLHMLHANEKTNLKRALRAKVSGLESKNKELQQKLEIREDEVKTLRGRIKQLQTELKDARETLKRDKKEKRGERKN